MIRLVISLFMLFQDIHGLNTYVTPAADDSFEDFPITEFIPSDGKQGVGPIQNALTIADFNRQYVTFNFKGKGNAQLLIHSDADTTSEGAVTVVIGGGSNNNKLTIYNLKLQEVLNETTLDTITSEHEFRSFWIRFDSDTEEMFVGLCHDPYQNQILSAQGIQNFKLLYISLSTTSNNSGEWEFASDNEILGGCTASSDCNGNYCMESDDSFLRGTCVEASQQVPDDGFGNGRCRTGSTESPPTSSKVTKSPITPNTNTTPEITTQFTATATSLITITTTVSKEISTSLKPYKRKMTTNKNPMFTTGLKQYITNMTASSGNTDDLITDTSFSPSVYFTSKPIEIASSAVVTADKIDSSSTPTVPNDDNIENKTLHKILMALASVGGVACLGLVTGLAYRCYSKNSNGRTSFSSGRCRNKVEHECGKREDSNATLEQAGMS